MNLSPCPRCGAEHSMIWAADWGAQIDCDCGSNVAAVWDKIPDADNSQCWDSQGEFIEFEDGEDDEGNEIRIDNKPKIQALIDAWNRRPEHPLQELAGNMQGPNHKFEKVLTDNFRALVDTPPEFQRVFDDKFDELLGASE